MRWTQSGLALSVILGCCLGGTAAAAPAQTIELNELASVGSPQDFALRAFQTAVASGTHGKVIVKLHLSGALGNAQTSVQNMMFRELNLYSGNLTDYLPLMIDEMTGLQTPFLIPGMTPTGRYLASPLLDEAREKVLHSRHIRFLEMTAIRNPFHVIAAKREIATPADLVGLKLVSDRPLTKTAARVWQALGVQYIAPSSIDIKTALESGQADAVLFTNLDAVSQGVASIAPHLAGVDDCPQLWQISINEGIWQQLDDSQRTALQAAAQQALQVYERRAQEQFQKRLATMTSAGHVTYHVLDANALRAKVLPVYPQLVAEGGLSPRVLEAASAALTTEPRP
jgi:TRAP-type C4-dicarboxylate transport system substrate-binding protein